LLRAAQVPVAAPSANPSGRLSPTTAQHVAEGLGQRVDLILDGGPCRIGVESTVVDCRGEAPILLRPGGVPEEAIEAVAGVAVQPAETREQPLSPGQLSSHYAPRARLRLNAASAEDGEALLAFGPEAPAAAVVRNLSESGNLEEAAANLFAMLRELDASGAHTIAVMPV